MITFSITQKAIEKSDVSAKIFFVEANAQDSKNIIDVAQKYMPNLQDVFMQQGFTGQVGKIVIVPVSYEGTYFTLYFVGLGTLSKKKTLGIESYRRALGAVIKALQKNKERKSSFALPNPKKFDLSWFDIAKETAIIGEMGLYNFDTYITDETSKLIDDIAIELSLETNEKLSVEKGLIEGAIIAKSVNTTRHWIDLPPCDLTPIELAGKAEKIAQEYGLKITIFDEATIKKMGMGGLAAVSAGSEQDCRFVVMEYQASEKNAQTIAFVGKGITFDSGGINLKPRGYIENMKQDMSGAAAVISTLGAIAQLKPKVNVIGIASLSENLLGGKATKPGDIITFYNGKTAEIQDTDAEGRLILADALAYAVKHYKPDAIIDIATLTGACAYALGPFFSGLMSTNQDLKERIFKASELSGDRVWELPLHEDYKPAMKSLVADLSNVGNRKYLAGAITAAIFLQYFVNDTPWAHLDIAGTAFDVPDISYYSTGIATGVGVRLLISLAQSWQ